VTVSDAAPPRLDVWIAEQRRITRHAARTLIDAGCVTVNGGLGRPGQRVRPSDVVHVDESVAAETGAPPSGTRSGRRHANAMRALNSAAPAGRSTLGSPWGHADGPARLRDVPSGGAPAQPVALEIVYEDDWLAVVDKPAGLVVHPAAGHHGDTLADALRARGETWSLLGGEERAGIVHRLDRDTSGLLVVAKREEAHRALAQQLRTRTLGRVYWAMVHGGFRERTGSVEAPIGRHPRDRKRMAVVEGGREAATDFSVEERLGELSVLEVRLRTGRTHQIRVHLAYIKHPVVGDPVYGRSDQRLRRPALHAKLLSFVHPGDGRPRMFTSPLPAELARYLEAVRAIAG
jgi:23S rRNA pseudouridine1911/1915/1917 synthase